MKKLIGLILFIFLATCLWCHELSRVSSVETNKMARNWVAYINFIPLEGRDCEYQINTVESFTYKGKTLCSIYHLAPNGHIVVPHYREFIPIKSFSVISNFDTKSKGYEYVILEELKEAYDYLEGYLLGESKGLEREMKRNAYQWVSLTSIDFKKIDYEDSIIFSKNREVGQVSFVIKDEYGRKFRNVQAGPLINTRWNQRAPYWNWCPYLNYYRCYVGCVATAMAQIMRYYKWPSRGEGSHSYYWENGGLDLTAYFDDAYDWNYMPDETWEYNTYNEMNAVAELCYEAGVSIEMSYGTDGSTANTAKVAEALKKYFKYSNNIKVVSRNSYDNVDQWFNVFRNQRDMGRPVQFSIRRDEGGHSVVVDGYLISGDINYVHINMGWGGSNDAYYSLDGILDYSYTYSQRAVINIEPKWGRFHLNKNLIIFNAVEGETHSPYASFSVRNSGKGTMNYTVTSPYDRISVVPDEGSSNGDWDKIMVYLDISGLVEGKYSTTVELSSEEAVNSPQTINVEVTIAPPPIYAPINLSGTQVENRNLYLLEYINVLNWEPNPLNRHIEKYRIYSVIDGNLSLQGEVLNNKYVYWVRKVEKNGIYTYAIKAVDYKDREGPPAYVTVN